MPNTKLVTIQDIAAELKLSKMTVSAVLAGKADQIRISVQTQQRVREAAQRLGYRPNELARALRRRSTNILGFYTGHHKIEATDPWMYEIIGGLQAGCRANQKDLLLHTTFRGASVEDIYNELLDGRIDGLIYYGPIQDPLAERLRHTHLPVVAIVDALPDVPSVVGDDSTGSRLIVEHLVARGHRHVLYASQEMEATSVHQRQAALYDAAAQQGLAVESWGMILPGQEDAIIARWKSLPTAARWSAIVAWDDFTAYRLWAACRRASVRVPEELALVGFDGVATGLEEILRLTTIRVPWSEVAFQGVERLIHLLQGQLVPLRTILPVTLVPGDTA